MKILISALLLAIQTGMLFSQSGSKPYQEFSFTQFFEMIEAEKDSIFELKDAIIQYSPETDSILYGFDIKFKEGFQSGAVEFVPKRKDTLVINKEIRLDNVHFFYLDINFRGSGGLYNLKFNRPVRIQNIIGLNLTQCTFEDDFRLLFNSGINGIVPQIKSSNQFQPIYLRHNIFNKRAVFYADREIDLSDVKIWISECQFNQADDQWINDGLQIALNKIDNLTFESNWINSMDNARIWVDQPNELIINENRFGKYFRLDIDLKGTERFELESNTFGDVITLRVNTLNSEASITWPDLHGKILHSDAFRKKMQELQVSNDTTFNPAINELNKENLEYYKKHKLQITDEFIYKDELYLRGKFYDLFKSRHDNNSANMVYQEMKDMETERLAYLYEQQPSFKTYFTWKTNQFLKVFSAYGTEPSRAIIFSMYVILFFAFIYLFFPNTWDAHGRNRIIDRYKFFFKYLSRNAGIHEVYLEEKESELLTYEEFRNTIKATEKKVPRFFTWSAYPLYRWAISGSQITAGILKRFDILQGTWTDLPEKRKWWKGLLLTGAFIIALIYDLIIKMLNALMLSINTFTTLGFGEIPIKGLPRYLAIIQGFIGWFMLTIFSVSLISQLLN